MASRPQPSAAKASPRASSASDRRNITRGWPGDRFLLLPGHRLAHPDDIPVKPRPVRYGSLFYLADTPAGADVPPCPDARLLSLGVGRVRAEQDARGLR